MNKEDRMPTIDTPEYNTLKRRALQLSHDDICQLLEVAGITFASRRVHGKPARRSELLDLPKDILLEPLDEAKSRQDVEHFLTRKGV